MQIRVRTAEQDCYYCHGCGYLYRERGPIEVEVLDGNYEAGTPLDEVGSTIRTECHDEPPCVVDEDDWYPVPAGSKYYECGACETFHVDEGQAIACCQ